MFKYRVYDKKNKKWVLKNVYMNTRGELFLVKRNKVGIVTKFKQLDTKRFDVQISIGEMDKTGATIYVGDLVKKDGKIKGVVAFVPEKMGYVVLDYENQVFYILNKEICKNLEVSGNVYDNPDYIMKNNEKSDVNNE